MTHYDSIESDIQTKQRCLDLLERGVLTSRSRSGNGPWEDTTEYWKARLKDQLKELDWYLGKMRELDQLALQTL